MKYQKKQEWKKKLIGMMALLMAMILVLSMVMPFTTFGAQVPVAVANTVYATAHTTSVNEEEAADAGEKQVPMGTDRFRLEAEAGFDGNYIVGGYLPIRGVITALEGDFQGQLQVKSYVRNRGSGKEYAEYYQEMELGQGASKTFAMEVGLNNIQKNLEISLVDTKGNVVFRDYIAVQAKDPLTKAIAVLSDNKANLQYLSGMTLAHFPYEDATYNQVVAGQYNMTAFFDADTFPTTENMLSNFSVLILDDMHTSALTEAQKTALTDWVGAGGLLVAGTGGNGGKLLSGLPLFSEISQGGTKTVSGVMGLSEEVLLMELSADGLTIVAEEGGNPLISRLDYGQGSVLLSHFALSLTPVANSQETVDFLKEQIQSQNPERFYIQEQDYYRDERQSYVARRFPALEMNSLYLIMGIAVLYILVVGPVLYLVLKKKDRRELGWVIVPVLSVAFLGLGFLAAQSSGYKSGMLRTAAYVSMEEGKTVATADMSLAFKSAEKGKVTFTSEETLPVKLNTDQWNYYGGAERSRLLYRIRNGEGTEITYPENASWQTQYFSTKTKVDLGGNIESTVVLEDGRYKGEIVNHTNTTFTDVYLVLGGSVEQFGALGAGETLSVDLDTGAGERDMYGSYHSEIRAKVQMEGLSRREAFDLFNQAEMLSDYSNRNNMMNAIVPVEFFGFTEESLLAESCHINGKALQESNLTLYHQQFPINLSEATDFEIILQGIPMMSGKTDFRTDQDMDILYGMGEGTMEGEAYFEIPKDVRIDSIAFATHPEYGYQEVENLRLLNRKTGEYDAVSLTQLVEAADYIDENGQIFLGFSYEGNWETELPRLQVKGGGIYAGN